MRASSRAALDERAKPRPAHGKPGPTDCTMARASPTREFRDVLSLIGSRGFPSSGFRLEVQSSRGLREHSPTRSAQDTPNATMQIFVKTRE
jgi:hypothetical protein